MACERENEEGNRGGLPEAEAGYQKDHAAIVLVGGTWGNSLSTPPSRTGHRVTGGPPYVQAGSTDHYPGVVVAWVTGPLKVRGARLLWSCEASLGRTYCKTLGPPLELATAAGCV